MVQSTSLSDVIYKELLTRIEQKQYKQGDRLPTELMLSEEFNASRPVIRAALQKLKDAGFIISIRGSGSFVKLDSDPTLTQFTPVVDIQELIQCFDYRTILEGEIAYNAALHRNERDLIALKNTYELALQHLDQDYEGEMRRDLRFHLALAQASHNRFYFQALKILTSQLLDSISQVADHYATNTQLLYQLKDFWHSEIMRAIELGDPILAKTAMQMHVQRAKSNFLVPHQTYLNK